MRRVDATPSYRRKQEKTHILTSLAVFFCVLVPASTIEILTLWRHRVALRRVITYDCRVETTMIEKSCALYAQWWGLSPRVFVLLSAPSPDSLALAHARAIRAAIIRLRLHVGAFSSLVYAAGRAAWPASSTAGLRPRAGPQAGEDATEDAQRHTARHTARSAIGHASQRGAARQAPRATQRARSEAQHCSSATLSTAPAPVP